MFFSTTINKWNIIKSKVKKKEDIENNIEFIF
jgi:hypothetical protein